MTSSPGATGAGLSRDPGGDRVPVVALTGHLGAGKTTVLNHLLRQAGARVGVVVNDFGAINVDATLVRGQVDEPASIAGGCLCCLPDAGGLDGALEKLSHPRLQLDAILLEASGIAEPGAIARLIRYSGVERVRPGGLVEIVDAVEFFDTVGSGPQASARFACATLVVVNKADSVTGGELDAIEAQIRSGNGHAQIARVSHGRIDPVLVYDVDSARQWPDELPFDVDSAAQGTGHHVHADAVTAAGSGPIDPGLLMDLLEAPSPNVYRLKGRVTVAVGARRYGYLVNVVGRAIHIRSSQAREECELVAIGVGMDVDAVQARLASVLESSDRPDSAGLRRLQRYRRLSE